MNSKKIIESGQIELFVAGALPEDENRLIEELAIEYPDISNEIKEAEDAWDNFARAYARNPRPHLRKKLMDQVIKEGAKIPLVENEKNDNTGEGSEIKWWLTAAAIGLLIMVSALNFMFYIKWSEAEMELAKLRNSINIENNEAEKDSLTEIN
ncbi:MAG: hypothetical protein ACR2GN_10360 [Bacteroidia bacterium]